MVFGSPQWRWGKDEPRQYGPVSNRVSIVRGDREVGGLYVNVPAELFLLIPVLFGSGWPEGISFYLDELTDRSWVFGIRSETAFFDLWRYTSGSLPDWLCLR